MIKIVLLSYSISWCQSHEAIPSTGEVTDSLVLIPIDAIRAANAKMIELKFQREINDSLRSIIANDDVIISKYDEVVTNKNKTITNLKKQRNSVIFGGIVLLILSVLL